MEENEGEQGRVFRIFITKGRIERHSMGGKRGIQVNVGENLQKRVEGCGGVL